jgi:GPH family glycoside/pentoside/hexuronide:cation symporter
MGATALWSILGGWLLYFYLPPDGQPRVPAALYGVATFIPSVLHLFVDPAIGYWSDHTRSRWGRRLPFMFFAIVPLLFFFVLLWTPPVAGESLWNLAYLTLVLGAYNVIYSVHQIPYEALLPELALTDAHRVRISAWYAGFQVLGMILGGLAAPLIERVGYVSTAWIFAGVLLLPFYLPFLVLRERPGRQIEATERLDFRRSLLTTLRNRPFRLFSIAWSLYWITMTLVQTAMPFVATEVCGLTKGDTLYFYLPAVVASLACYPLVTWLAGRWGKWPVFCGSLVASAAILPTLMLVGDWLPGSPAVQGFVWVTLQAVALSGAVILPSAFAAEITDYDERLTGQRREGAYYATWGVLDHLTTGLGGAMLSLLLLLGRGRSDPYGPLGVRLVGVVGGILMLAAFLVFLRYPLREKGGVAGLEAGESA